MKFRRWLKSKKISGKIKKPEDFIVKEILPSKFFKKFERSKNGIKKIQGKYNLFLLKKRNITTDEAINFIMRKSGIDKNKIGYAGLKDKFAVTEQYITIHNDVKICSVKEENIELEFVGKTNYWLNIGDLSGNEFIITLHNCKNINKIGSIIKEIDKRGILNYFGLQRFGKNMDNHKNGKMILKGKINIENFGKDEAKFLVHAYQSYIFNKVLNEYTKRNKKPCFKEIPIVGFNTKLGNNKIDKIIKKILKKEQVSAKDFMIQKKIKCIGSERKMFIKPKITYKIECDKIVLKFFLPKGSYATVVLSEISDIL